MRETNQKTPAEFLVSSFSGGGSCVAVSRVPNGGAAVRHSTDPMQSAVLNFTRSEWDAFLRGVKAGEFDLL